MEALLKKWKERAESDYSDNRSFLFSLKNDSSIDNKVKAIHEEVFGKADCLACANCCKTTPAIVERGDIKRIAKFLGIPPKTFIRKYVLEDFGGQFVIQKVPCTFLKSDNTCSIYEVRPKACREYPHTNQENFFRRGKLNAKNTLVCPAAYAIVERLKTSLNNAL